MQKQTLLDIGFILSCLSISLVHVLPVFDKRPGVTTDIVSQGHTIEEWESGDSPVDGEAFNYWYAPENSFGISETKTVNWSYWKPWLHDMFDWNLRASPDNVTWYNARQLLDIGVDFNETSQSAKVTLTLDTTGAPRDLYYQFYILCNKTLKSYAEVDGYEWILTLPANDSEDYTVFFNWSDIKKLVSSGKVWYDVRVTDDDFIFGIQTVNKIVPGVVFVVDPTFGNENPASGSTNGYGGPGKRGNPYTLTESGMPTTISIQHRKYANNDNAVDYQLGIYDNDTGSLIARTEERSLLASGWYDFDINWTNASYDPPLQAGNDVILVFAYGDTISLYFTSVSDIYIDYQMSGYEFEDPLDKGDDDGFWLYAMYCTYTAYTTNFSGANPEDDSFNETIGIIPVNITITNDKGSTSTCDWYTSSDGESWTWVQTNSSILNESISYDYTTSEYQTTYYWKVTANNTYGTNSTSSIYNFETTPYRTSFFNDTFPNENWIDTDRNMTHATGWQNFTVGSGEITFVSNTSAINDPATTVTIDKPSDVQDGDVLFVFLFHDNNDPDDEFNTLDGWIQIFNLTDDPSGRGGTTWYGYHIVTDSGSEPADYTFTHTDGTAEDTGGIIVNLRGINTNDPLANDTGYTYLFDDNNGDFNSPSITTDEDNALVLCMGSMSHAMTSCVAPTNTNLIKFLDHDYCNLMIAYYTQEIAGATGDKQWDTDGTQEARGGQVAFRGNDVTSAWIVSSEIFKTQESWEYFYAHVNDTNSCSFALIDPDDKDYNITSGLNGDGDDISSVTNASVMIYGNFSDSSVNMGSWNISWTTGGAPPANTPPTQSGESPVNSSIDISTTPDLYVIVSDTDGDTINATWRYNDTITGQWYDFATNTSIVSGTNITQNNANFTNSSATYYWSINISDGMGGWNNETYHFTSGNDTLEYNLNTHGYLTGGNTSIYNPLYYKKVTINEALIDNTYEITRITADMNSHQGYTTDGTYHYFVDTNTITKRNTDMSLADTNNDLGGDVGITANDHCGDIDYYNGYLYVPVENWVSCDSHSEEYIAIFWASNLTFKEKHEIDLGEVAGVCVDPDEGTNGTIYVVNYCDDDSVMRFDLNDFTSLGNLSLSTNAVDMQGITERNDFLYISSDGSDSIKVYHQNNGTYITDIYTWGDLTTEGLDYSQDELRIMRDDGNNEKLNFLSSLSNYPILFKDTSNDYVNHAETDGGDFSFWSIDNTTQYSHEIEEYNSTTGELIAWVKIPDLMMANYVQKEFWIKYGDNTTDADQDKFDVWSNNFTLVYHCNETSGGLFDSSGHDRTGNITGSMTQDNTGMVDGADQFMGETSNVLVNTTYKLPIDEGSIEIWYKPDQFYDYNSIWDNSVDENWWECWIYSDGRLRWKVSTPGDDDWYCTYDLDNLNGASTWYYITATWRKEVFAKLFVNDTLRESDTIGDQWDDAGEYFGLGGMNPNNDEGDGVFDEVRISSTSRSSGWINTTYQMIADPTTFLTIGTELGITNTAPTFSGESPVDKSTDISVSTSVYVVVSDADSDTMTCNFYNSTGGMSWTWQQTNTSVSSGTNISWDYTEAMSYNTKYYWKVTADDGTDNSSDIYEFTTEAISKTWNTHTTGYLTGGNDTLSHNLQTYGYLTGGNDTLSYNLNTNGYLIGGNDTLAHNLHTHGYLLGGNTSGYSLHTYGYLQGGNDTLNHNLNTYGYLLGGNDTLTWNNNTYGYLLGGNETVSNWNLTITGYLTGGNISSHDIYEPSFETVNNWTYYENNTNCDGGQSSSGVTHGSKSYGLSIDYNVGTGYCKVYQEHINLTNIDHVYTDIYINADPAVDVPAYVSIRVNGDILWEHKIIQTEQTLHRNISIDTTSYNDYCTLEYRLNMTDIGFFDEGIFVYFDNIRTRIQNVHTTGYLTGGNDTLSYSNNTYGYLLGGNDTLNHNLNTYGYLTGGNDTISYNLNTYGYLLGGNETSPDWNNTIYGYLLGGNDTLIYNNNTNGYLLGGNDTLTWNNHTTGYLLGGSEIEQNLHTYGYLQGGNDTLNHNMNTWGYLTGNCSHGIITGTPTPANHSNENPITLKWQILINTTNGISFNWSLNCSNGQQNYASNENNGTKNLSLTSLNYETTYTIWLNATNANDTINETYYFNTTSLALTGDFDYSVQGQTITVTPTFGLAVEQFKWKIENDINGETEWIDVNDSGDHKYVVNWNQTYKITLLYRNSTLMKTINKLIGVGSNKNETIPTTPEKPEPEPSKYKNIDESLPEGIKNWLRDRTTLDWVIITSILLIILLYILTNKKGRKTLYLPIKKKKKNK